MLTQRALSICKALSRDAETQRLSATDWAPVAKGPSGGKTLVTSPNARACSAVHVLPSSSISRALDAPTRSASATPGVTAQS
eukprot:COSAG03_NODE_253_length_9917_cov_116.496944_3_plen_82_part_00